MPPFPVIRSLSSSASSLQFHADTYKEPDSTELSSDCCTMVETRDETARFSYLQWQKLYETEKPFQVFSSISCDAEEQRPTNLQFLDGDPQLIRDIRGREAEFDLDTNGFIIRNDSMRDADLSTEEGFRRDYLPHIEEMMREHVDGIDHMVCFDWGVSLL
jgi:hypothetical protein